MDRDDIDAQIEEAIGIARETVVEHGSTTAPNCSAGEWLHALEAIKAMRAALKRGRDRLATYNADHNRQTLRVLDEALALSPFAPTSGKDVANEFG